MLSALSFIVLHCPIVAFCLAFSAFLNVFCTLLSKENGSFVFLPKHFISILHKILYLCSAQLQRHASALAGQWVMVWVLFHGDGYEGLIVQWIEQVSPKD